MKRSSMYSNETRKIRKLINEEVELGIHPSSDSETEEVDLHKELHSLSHYMNNKEEMIEQMFSIIKGDKLMKMLPPILKDMPMDELKADCLIHLLGMSKKRIMAILEGKEINSSSDSETHSESSSPRRKRKPFVKPIIIKQEGCSDISDNSEEVILIDPDRELFENLTNTKSMTAKTKGSNKSRKRLTQRKHKLPEKKAKPIKENQELDNQESESEDVDESPENTNRNEDGVPKEGKTLLEILELEMRARAIRALLHKGENKEGNEELNVLEKLSESKNISGELKNNKITPKKKFRKKKRKSDDVIVITPKVVTIDLTDENDISSTNKKRKESTNNSRPILENNWDESSTKDDATKELETNNKEDVANENQQINLIDEETDCTEINNSKDEPRSEEPDITLESSAKDIQQLNPENLQKTEEEKSNWAQRWLESKEVKKVVSTSKICGNIRKRIKNAKLAKKNQKQNQKSEPEKVEPLEIHGSVNEYQLLSKSITVSDTNASTLVVCNSESSLMSNKDCESDNEKQTESKDEMSSVEQVQDVSSTKNETKTDGTETVLDDSNDDNVTDNPETNNCNQETFHVTSESGDIETTDLNQNNSDSNSAISNSNNLSFDKIEKINLNDPDSQCIDNESDKNKLPIECNMELKNKRPDLNDSEHTETAECIILPSENDRDYKSSDQDQLVNQSLNKEHPNTSNQSCIDGSCESTSNNVINIEEVKTCESNSTINKNQINEPEALEINLTDEDRNID